jgi:hypothetical protein
MPKGDNKGPNGAGPKTGRGMGLCASHGKAGFMNRAKGSGFMGGRGMRFRRGFGRGFGFDGAFACAIQPADEKELLSNQAAVFETGLKAVKARMEEIEKSENR